MQKSFKYHPGDHQKLFLSNRGISLIAIFATFLIFVLLQQRVIVNNLEHMVVHSETVAIETAMSDVALREVSSFNPEKRTAFFLVLSQENGYEDRYRKHLLLNESDKFLARNELMRSFLAARQISPASQESLANLFDALDASITQEYALENRANTLFYVVWTVGILLFVELFLYIRRYVF